MDIELWCVRNKFVHKLNEYIVLHKDSDAVTTFDSIIALADIIPIQLLQLDSCKFTGRIKVYTGFNNIMDCINWIYELNVTMTRLGYFKGDLMQATVRRQVLTMDNFLIDSKGQLHLPGSILTTLRRTIMDCSVTHQNALIRNPEMGEYYSDRLPKMLNEVQHVVECFSNLALEV